MWTRRCKPSACCVLLGYLYVLCDLPLSQAEGISMKWLDPDSQYLWAACIWEQPYRDLRSSLGTAKIGCTSRVLRYVAHARFPIGKKHGGMQIAIHCRKCCISATERFCEKPFWPSLPAKYVVSFSGRTDASEVSFALADRLIDRPNYRNPRCACVPRVNKSLAI